MRSRAAGWQSGAPQEERSGSFHGRENDAAGTVAHATRSKGASDWIKPSGASESSFSGRENDAAAAVKAGGIKDKLSAWQHATSEGAGAGGFKGRENDAAAAVASSRVRNMTSSWQKGEVAEEKQEWHGRENDAAILLAKGKQSEPSE